MKYVMCVCVFALIILMMIHIGIGKFCVELFNVALGSIMQLQGMGTNVVNGCSIDHFIHRTNCSFPSNRRL